MEPFVADDYFDSDKYVKQLCADGHGAQKLVESRQQFQNLADETSLQLKKNVYRNYTQFIDTAKEITHLESDMYKLSHMLTEQRSVLNALSDMCTTSAVRHPSEPTDILDDFKQKRDVSELLDEVEGSAFVSELSNSFIIHDGDLTEVDQEDFHQMQRVHLYLLNDCVIMVSVLPVPKGPLKYKFLKKYDLKTLAVVNFRDIEHVVRNAFKILMFPDAHMFTAESSKIKKEWLDMFELSKKARLERAEHHHMSGDVLSDAGRSGGKAARSGSALSSSSGHVRSGSVTESDAPLHTSVTAVTQPGGAAAAAASVEGEYLRVEWVTDLPEDLDVAIAQRDFECAVQLIEKVKDYLSECPKGAEYKEFESKVSSRIAHLTSVLTRELQVSSERTLQGGPRSARRAVTLLIRLGRSAHAADLFLTNRAGTIRHSLKQLKIEGTVSLYIKRLSIVFFNHIIDAAVEFQKAFATNTQCYSAFILFAKQQLELYMSYFCRQVLDNKAGISSVAECVHIARSHCNELVDSGLDLTYIMDSSLYNHLRKLILDHKDKIIEANRTLAAEDTWEPMNLENKANVDKFISDMNDIGIANLHNFVYEDERVSLTQVTSHFIRSYMLLLDDLLKLYTHDLHSTLLDSLFMVFKAHLLHIEASIKSEQAKEKQKFILWNASFLLENVLPIVEYRVEERTGQSCKQLNKLQRDLNRLKGVAKNTIVTPAF